MLQQKHEFPYSWEEAIEILRADPQHRELVHDAYLTADLLGNCRRFADSAEFIEVRKLIGSYRQNARDVLDIPAGNGIATYAFARAGFDVEAICDPDEATINFANLLRSDDVVLLLTSGGLGGLIEQLPRIAEEKFPRLS